MSTGAKKVDIFLKKFLTQQQITENFFDYNENKIHETLFQNFRKQGVFEPSAAASNVLSSSAINTFDIFTPLVGTDDAGHVLNLDPADGLQVPFENTNAIDYFVGLRFVRIPRETEVNVRTAAIKYTFLEEGIGVRSDPDAVIDDGDETLTVTVDSVTEAGVSNAGRKVLIFLKGDAENQSQAFETLTVIFSGGANKIETATALGQTLGNISTDPADYEVILLGPEVKRNTDLRTDPSVMFLGIVEGAGIGNSPVNFDESDQTKLFSGTAINSLLDTSFSFLVDGGVITWELSTENLTWSAALKFVLPNRSFDFTIAPTTISLTDGQVGYIIKDAIGGAKIIQIVANGALPDDPDVVPIMFRSGNNIYFRSGALELKGNGALPTVGRIDGINQNTLDFMGAVDETDVDPNYNTTNIINQGDPLKDAISDLDVATQAILDDTALEEEFIVGGGGQSVFNISTFIFDPLNTVQDLIVFENGQKLTQDTTGGLNKDYRKNSNSQIEFSFTVTENSVISVRLERTGAGNPVDLENINVNMAPDADGAKSVGTAAKGFSKLVLKDTVTGNRFRIEMINGTLTTTQE